MKKATATKYSHTDIKMKKNLGGNEESRFMKYLPENSLPFMLFLALMETNVDG